MKADGKFICLGILIFINILFLLGGVQKAG